MKQSSARSGAMPRGGHEGKAEKATPAGPVHALPSDLKEALAADGAAKATWDDITPLARNEWICWVTSAKQAATRERRIAVGLDKLRKGMRRPCCWPGCPHR